METTDHLRCDSCGCAIASHALWCGGCGAAVAPYRTPRFSTTSEREKLEESIAFYRTILADLKVLARQHEVSDADQRTICDVYSGLMARKSVELADLRRQSALEICLHKARSLVQPSVGQLATALKVVDRVSRDYPDDPLLQNLQSQIWCEQERRAKAARRTREASELLTTARSCLTSDPATAEQKLLRAQTLAPENKQVAETLELLRLSREQQQAEERQRMAERERIAKQELIAEQVRATQPPVAAELTPPLSEERIGEGTESRTAGDLQSLPVSSRTSEAEHESVMANLVIPEEETRGEPPQVDALPGVQDELTTSAASTALKPEAAVVADEYPVPNPWKRIVETTSQWSSMLKPFLVDNVGWFVGAFLIVAGFVVLIVAFRQDIGDNPVLMWSLVFWTLVATTGVFFAVAYFMRRRYPQLETSSNVLLTIVTLLIPLVFAAAALTTLAV